MDWHKLIIYRSLLDDQVIRKTSLLQDMLKEPVSAPTTARESLYYDIYSQLIGFSQEQQLPGDIWHNYLVGLLARDENPFSRAGERGAGIPPGLFKLIIRDMEIIRQAFTLDWAAVTRAVGPDVCPILRCFQPGVGVPAAVGYATRSRQRPDNDGRPTGRILRSPGLRADEPLPGFPLGSGLAGDNQP